jgi:hypothetical protein
MSNEQLLPSKTIHPNITEIIIYALRQEYTPVHNWEVEIEHPEEIEYKTTIDLMEEIQGFGETNADIISLAMIDAGFSIRTINGAPFWLLRKK